MEEVMQDNDASNSDRQFDHLLRSSRPDPVLPPRFEEGVWRRIERLENEGASAEVGGWAERLVARLLRPRLAAMTALGLVLAGALAGILSATSNADQVARDRYVASVAPQQIR